MASVETPVARPPYAVAARELLRNTLLDGARRLLADRAWTDITMADIAAAGGVSRQTLYSEFGSRSEFAQAFVLREADLFLTTVEEALHRHPEDPVAALAAAFEVFLVAAADDPLVRSIVSAEDDDGLLPLVTTKGGPVVEVAAERLAAAIVAGWPHVSPADARPLADCLVRLGISHAALPTQPAGEVAAAVSTLLAPYVERIVGPARPR